MADNFPVKTLILILKLTQSSCVYLKISRWRQSKNKLKNKNKKICKLSLKKKPRSSLLVLYTELNFYSAFYGAELQGNVETERDFSCYAERTSLVLNVMLCMVEEHQFWELRFSFIFLAFPPIFLVTDRYESIFLMQIFSNWALAGWMSVVVLWELITQPCSLPQIFCSFHTVPLILQLNYTRRQQTSSWAACEFSNIVLKVS